MANKPQRRTRILFVSEAVTLAHFARPVALTQALDEEEYEVFLASDPRYLGLLSGPLSFRHIPIRTIPSNQFTQALAKGSPIYDFRTLGQYVEDDLALLDSVRPDLIVGDFRLSLAVSAPVAKIPYVSLINAYWSPYAHNRYIVPELPLTRILGPAIGQQLFRIVRPVAFALHTVPLNRVRRRYGLASLGFDLRRIYSWADCTLYPDIPEAMAMRPLPLSHRFIGPVLWSPTVSPPDWWRSLPADKPIVYVTLGSSGRADLLPIVLKALANMPVTVIASSAGHQLAGGLPENAHVADYLPGDLATQRASLVICNGGSLTTYQAAAMGVPVLGLPSNMDQHLNMLAMAQLGVGFALRTEEAKVKTIRAAAARVMSDPECLQAAGRAAATLEEYDSAVGFREVVGELLS